MMNHRLALATVLIFAAAQLAGCSHGKVNTDVSSSGGGAAASPADVFGPPPPPPSPMGPEAPMGPLPTADYTPPNEGYVLVLGPGLARALAYIGVLREFEARKIPIRGIVGVEMGALVGTIWASSSANTVEWELQRFKRATLLDVPLLPLRSRVAEGKALVEFLGKAVKVETLEKMKVPTVVVSAIRGSESVLAESTGSARDLVRGAMGIPGLIQSYFWDGKERETAALETPFPADKAKALGVGKVVCVDVVGRGDNYAAKEGVDEQLATLMRSVAVNARHQLRECDVVLSIPTEGIGYLGFDAKADLINRGRQAVRRWQEPPK